ncbi:uncharacterized protein MAM_03107 [Metarhizium album ARSEF 1941]|uniref:Uncharacterized protein n=1 Tax=Metarhizium album (strain ARSEF 1941) TaxID=1081103 RepID=A0A0B2X0N3_METAS|nr:uncharacterized protein MAM_03107 [Metarhizium album ARSEF 1941]KHN99409.1 hypothetical protein MAM_03107 [Metarhizium album ARSEF 1941]
MVGLASGTGSKVEYGSVRKGQPATSANKSLKSSHGGIHTRRDLSASQDKGIMFNEPLNNPNWRRRRGPDGQDHSSAAPPKHTEPSDRAIPLATLPWHQKLSSFQPDPMKKSPSIEDVLQKSGVEFEPCIDAHGHSGDVHPGWSAHGDFPGSCVSDKHFFDVVRRAKLHSRDQGRALDLFGVVRSQNSSYSDKRCAFTRLSSGDESVDDRFLQMISRKHTLTPDESHGYQLMAALKATEPTPRKVGRTPSSSQDASQHLSCLLDQSPVPSNKKNVRSFETCRVDSKDSGFSFSWGSQQEFANDDDDIDEGASDISGRRRYVLEQKDIAFQKLIKRLNGANSQEKKQFDGSRDSGYEADSMRTQDAQSQRAETASASATRRPTHGTGRRVNTASDFAVRYWPASESRREDHSTDSTAGDAPDKYNSLNPKAREFLSFSQKTEGAMWKSRRPGLLPFDVSIDGQADKNRCGEVLSSELEHKARTNSHFVPPAEAAAVPFVNATSMPLLFQPFAHSNASLLGLIPLMPDAYKPMMGQPGGWPASHAVTTMANTCRPSQARALVPEVTQNAPLHSIPSPASPLHVAVPTASSSIPRAARTNGSLPRRVPKPKQPNPKDQQEYEAWVEWRKATEPGYAMACKLRQQRRAQRNGPRTKSEQQAAC